MGYHRTQVSPHRWSGRGLAHWIGVDMSESTQVRPAPEAEVLADACHNCYRHKRYRMTCTDFESLAARSADRCEACGVMGKPLAIDHDHDLGDHAVRGLVCARCNYQLSVRDPTLHRLTEGQIRYLASPFWQENPHPGIYEIRLSPKGGPGHLISIPDTLWMKVQDKRGRGSAAAVVARAIEEYVK